MTKFANNPSFKEINDALGAAFRKVIGYDPGIGDNSKRGAGFHNKVRKQDRILKAQKLHKQGKTIDQIADALDVKFETVVKYLDEGAE